MWCKSLLLLALVATGSQALQLRQKKKPGQVSMECQQHIQKVLTPQKQQAAGKCEKEKGYAEKAINKLQAGDEKAAEALVAKSFQDCAGVKEECAQQMAPNVVMKMRFAGLGVCDTCVDEMKAAQSDQAKMEKVMKCEDDLQLSKQMVGFLNKEDLDGALGLAEKSLTKCIGFEDDRCAKQLAPVIVNQLLEQVMSQQQMMPLFIVEQPVCDAKPLKTAIEPRSSKKHASLLQLALSPSTVSPKKEQQALVAKTQKGPLTGAEKAAVGQALTGALGALQGHGGGSKFSSCMSYFSDGVPPQNPAKDVMYQSCKSYLPSDFLTKGRGRRSALLAKAATELSPECQKHIQETMTPELEQKAGECEAEKKYGEDAIGQLQAGDEKAAVKTVAKSFVECAGIKEECAAEMAPKLVQKMRFAGLAVSEECANEMNAWQSDEKKAKEVQECEAKENVQQNVVDLLKKNDLEGAADSAEKSLEKCIKFKTEHCAEQIAPMLVGSLIQQLTQPQMMPLMVAEAPGCVNVVQEGDHLEVVSVEDGETAENQVVHEAKKEKKVEAAKPAAEKKVAAAAKPVAEKKEVAKPVKKAAAKKSAKKVKKVKKVSLVQLARELTVQ